MIETFYLKKGSIVHNLDLWSKFICLLISIPLASFIAPDYGLILITIYFLSLLILSKIRILSYWQSFRIYFIIVIISIPSLSLIFNEGILIARLTEGIILSIRFLLLIASGLLFSFVTDPMEIPQGVIRIGIPHRYGVAMMVGYRMMPLVSERIVDIIGIQRARGLHLEISINNIKTIVVGSMALIIPIVYTTLEISVALSDTLLARGYNPNSPSITTPPSKTTWWDFLIILTSIFLVLLIVFTSTKYINEFQWLIIK